MLLLDLLAEQKISAAVSRGEFDGLPGQGRPLDLKDYEKALAKLGR